MKHFSRFAITPGLTLKMISGVVVLGALSYFAWQIYPVFRAPKLVMYEPAGDFYTADTHAVFRGKVESGARLTVNREGVYVDERGNFSQPIALASGVNVIDVTAEGRFGRKTKLTRYVVYNADTLITRR